jgi:hypothetical protein
MLQNALTVITKIKPEEVTPLRQFLTIIGQDIKGKRDNSYVHFANLQTTHFARWVIINEHGDPHLMFSSNHDGTWEEYIDLLIEKISPSLDKIWGRCEGYPAGREQNPKQFQQDFKQYIWKHYIEPDTFYLGYRGIKATELKGYQRLQERIGEILDMEIIRSTITELLPYMPMKPEIQQSANAVGKFLKDAFNIVQMIGYTVVYFLYLAIIKPLQLRARGTPKINYVIPPTKEDGQYEAKIEDLISQNQMTVITRIKPGFFRLMILKMVLAFIHAAAKYMFNEGSLSNIATIHFARWIIIDDGKHLLFESNYDSTWESYIGDFVDKVSNGMNAVWRHSEGFPETKGLIFTERGCKDIDDFKTYIRRNQIEAQTFYSAYPTHTVRNLLAARKIGESPYRQDVMKWLSRF